MMKHLNSARFLLLGLILLLVGTAVSCNTSEETAKPTTEEAVSETEIPEEVMVVRESALEQRMMCATPGIISTATVARQKE